MRKFRNTIVSWLALSLPAAHALAGMEQMLDGDGLVKRLVGNTIHFHAPSEDVYLFLARDGSIHGESSVHGKFAARWRLYKRDSFCFQNDDPMASGCVSVVLDGAHVTFHRRDGVIEGPFEFLAGNPRML